MTRKWNLRTAGLFLALCLMFPLSIFAQDYVGDWTTKVPAGDGTEMEIVVSMKADGTYTVDLGGDGTADINGRYTVKDGKMTIRDTGGPQACEGEGVYRFKAAGNNLMMIRESDDCEGRGGPEGRMAFTKK